MRKLVRTVDSKAILAKYNGGGGGGGRSRGVGLYSTTFRLSFFSAARRSVWRWA